MKIFLIGLPGSGKSFIGKQLAKAMQLPFIDLDIAIQEKEGVEVSEIFATKGQDYFRQVEANVLREQIIKSHFIMATGGGTPCFFNNIELMNSHGVSVFLNTPLSVITGRLNAEKKNTRPLLASEHDIEQTLDKLLTTRMPFYNLAHITINGEAKVFEIIEAINSTK